MSSYDKPGPLDGAIDQAVREMMTIDPRPGLRRRVTNSIKIPSHRAPGLRFGLAALGVVMAALLSIVVGRQSDPARPVHAPQVAVTAPAAPATPLAGPQAIEPLPPAVSAPELARPRAKATTPAPTPESIFGPRQGRVAAASVSSRSAAAVAAVWVAIPADAARWSAMTPITFQPMMVVPLAIQPLFTGPRSPRK